MVAKRFVKYNPAFLSDKELVDNFVVRHADLELIIRIIGDNISDSNQHLLIIGPRGSGKTTLVRRVNAEIGLKEELRGKWYPLIFSEESYKVVSAADFWLEALFHLADQTGDEKWLRAHNELRNESDDQKVGERALWQILDFADSQKKRVLLIVENLNMLFSDLTSEDEAWKIRHTLMHEPRLMLLATATSRFENIDSPSHAMFEMFKVQELKPLNDDECNAVWELVVGSKLIGEQIKPIRILTGGNLRLLAIIAKFGAHRSFQQLLDDLIDLIDDHTDYFKSHLDNMPAIERKVYLALAELWKLSTAREIAAVARLDVNKTSSLLSRLVGRSAVFVEEEGKRTKWYRVSEGIYNIYYLMRRRGKPADRVKAVVSFMIAMYGPEATTRLIADDACKLSPELCSDHYEAYKEVIKKVSDHQLLEKIITATPKTFLDSPYISETVKNFATIDSKLIKKEKLSSKEDKELKEANELIEHGFKLGREGNFEQAVILFDHVINKFGSTNNFNLKIELTRARVNKGVAFNMLGKSHDALTLNDEVIGQLVNEKEPALLELVAAAMFSKGVALDACKRPDDAIRVYDEIAALYKDRLEVQIAEHVAAAMFNKGVILGKLNRSDEEIQVYDEIAVLYKDRTEPQLAEQVAQAMYNKGVTLGKLNRSDDAIRVYDKIVALYKGRTETQLAEQVSESMYNKGVTLGKLNRFDEEIQIYDEIVALYKDRTEPQFAEQVASAMYNKGVTLGTLNRPDDAIQVYYEIVELYKDRPEPQITEKVISAMFNKGVTLGQLNRPDDAIRAYDEIVALYKDRLEPQLAEQVAKATVNKGVTLGMLNRPAEEIRAYDEIVARFKDRPETLLAGQVAKAMFNKGVRLGTLNRSDEEILIYDKVAALYKDRLEPQIAVHVAGAMVNKGVTLGRLNRPDDAIRVYDEIVALYKDRLEPQLAEQVARAIVNKGVMFGMLNRADDETRVYDEIIVLYKDRPEPQLVEQVARAMFYKGMVLDQLNKYDDAEKAYRNALDKKPNLTAAHVNVIRLLLRNPEDPKEVLRMTEEVIRNRPDDSELLNSLAYVFYEYGDSTLLPRAEVMARQAIAISPDNLYLCHTLACILAAMGKGREALESATTYVKKAEIVEETIEEAIELFVELAAAGYAKEALDILVNSPAEKYLEPLVVGLRLYVGEDVKTSIEISEVAKDLVKRIEEQRKKRQ